MATNTYAERVNIIKYVKHADRWRFAPVVKRPSGSIHWDHVLIDAIPQHHAEGKYFIEWREGGVRKRKSVGTIPSDVLAEAQRQRALLDAKAAGIEIAKSESTQATRQLLVSDAAERYLGAALLVIVAAIFSSTGKKTPAQQAAQKGQPPQPTLQDNTDNNVQDLKNQLQAQREKEQQQPGCTLTRKASSTTARHSRSREKLLLSKLAKPQLTHWATAPKSRSAAKTTPTLVLVCRASVADDLSQESCKAA